MKDIKEIRNILNTFLIGIIKREGFNVNLSEGQSGMGRVYLYNEELKLKINNIKKSIDIQDYIHCRNNEATLLKNQNFSLICIILRNIKTMDTNKEDTFKKIVELYHTHDREQQDIDYLMYLIDKYKGVQDKRRARQDGNID